MFPFHFEKTVQAAAALLKQAPGHTMSAKRLITLLYIADRESIRKTGFPICGGGCIAIPDKEVEHGQGREACLP